MEIQLAKFEDAEIAKHVVAIIEDSIPKDWKIESIKTFAFGGPVAVRMKHITYSSTVRPFNLRQLYDACKSSAKEGENSVEIKYLFKEKAYQINLFKAFSNIEGFKKDIVLYLPVDDEVTINIGI